MKLHHAVYEDFKSLYLPLCSHLIPLKPEKQLHLNLVPLFLHLPPFKHGDESHAKAIEQKNSLRNEF